MSPAMALCTRLALLSVLAVAAVAAPPTPAHRIMLSSRSADNCTALARRGVTHQMLSTSLFPLASYQFLAANGSHTFPGDPYQPGTAAAKWRDAAVAQAAAELAAVQRCGLQALSSMDIFVVPTPIFTAHKANMTTPGEGHANRIALNDFTLWMLEGVLDEMVATFGAALDGIVVRVGENYGGPATAGAPPFVGNGAVDFSQPFPEQQAQYVSFINKLRDVVCERHGRLLLFRTWDTSGFSPEKPARFHPSREYYLNVTSKVAPHPLLVFSIKHVALDFWRWVQWNPCLGTGLHKQLIEVECQREYEGKGALPNYIGRGVLDGFSELGAKRVGLSHVNNDPRLVGLWVWASGGGWNGPHVGSQMLWPRMNAHVLTAWWAANATRTESEVFLGYCAAELGLSPADCAVLHSVALLSEDAILAMRYASAYDASLQGPDNRCGTVSCMPTNNWLRDDRLGGMAILGTTRGAYGNTGAIRYLYEHNTTHEALAEKEAAVSLGARILALVQSIHSGPESVRTELTTTATYGHLLAAVVSEGWQVMALGYAGDVTGHYDHAALAAAITRYDAATHQYNSTIAALPTAATPFLDAYEHGGGMKQWAPGLGASVNKYRQHA